MLTSFIVPALNEAKHIGRCLKSIQDLEVNDCTTIEILVVDNESTDDTVSIAKGYGCNVISVPPGKPSAARNQGVRHTNGVRLAFVDADCEIPTDWLTTLDAHFQDESVVGAGSGMATPRDDAPWVEKCWHDLAFGGQSSTFDFVPWLAGYNMLIDRHTFEKINGFDESLTTCEDSDLGYRLTETGKLVLDQRVRTRHHGESKTLRQFFLREAWRGQGSLGSLFSHKFRWSELLSILIPPAWLLVLVAGALLLGIGIAGSHVMALWSGLTSLGISLLLPMLFVIRRRAFRCAMGCYALMCCYLSARALGLLWSARRVER